jgi:hypothetical protein
VIRCEWKILAFGFLAAMFACQTVSAQDNREFRDWAADCDAAMACRAHTHDVGDDPGAYLLRLTRGRDEATWNLVLEVNDGHPERPYDIYADLLGVSVSFNGKVDAAAYGRPNDLHLLGPNAKAMMAQLRQASEARFEYVDEQGNLHEPRFSLNGLAASLLWIDETQQRLGSPREAGNPPEGLEPLETGAGTLDDLPDEVLIMHDRQDDCEAPEDLPNGDAALIIRLDDDRTLYLVRCYAGAYNVAHAAYVGSNGHFERLRFADYSTYTSWTVSDVIVNPEWDAATQRLSMFDRGRGLGDCGSIGEWRNNAGYLRLEKFFYKGECDAEGEPGRFPLIYEAPALEE